MGCDDVRWRRYYCSKLVNRRMEVEDSCQSDTRVEHVFFILYTVVSNGGYNYGTFGETNQSRQDGLDLSS